MTELILRIFELFREWLGKLIPWKIVDYDQIGVVLRLGKYSHTVEPGLRWKIPLIDEMRLVTSTLDTNLLAKQTLTTKDGVTVALRGIISYSVVDAKKYILDCNEADSVLNDSGVAALAEMVPKFTADEVLSSQAFLFALRKRVRRRSAKFGIYVRSFGLADRVKLRAYRLIGDV